MRMCEYCGQKMMAGDEMRNHKFNLCDVAMKEIEKLIYVEPLGTGVHLYRSTSTVIPLFEKEASEFNV